MKRITTFLSRAFATGIEAFKFTYKLDRRLTVWVGLFSAVAPVFTYGVSIITASIADNIQHTAKGGIAGGVAVLLAAYAVTLLLSGEFSQIKRYWLVQWRMTMARKIQDEVRYKRYSLDPSTIRSEKFETLLLRIRDSPMGWNLLRELSVAQFDSIATVISLVASLAIVCKFSVKMGLLLFVLSIPQFCADLSFGKKQWKLHGERAIRAKRRDVANSSFHIFRSLLEVKLFKCAPFLEKIIDDFENKFFNDVRKIEFTKLWTNIACDLIYVAGIIYCTYIIVQQTIAGDVQIGTMMLVITSGFSGVKSNSSTLFSQINLQFEQSRYMEDIKMYFGLTPLLGNLTNPKSLPAPQAAVFIEFRGVSFQYENSSCDALKNVSFTIKSGERLGIFGKNGSGKSTIVALLSRLEKPTSGEIYVNRINIEEIASEEWADHISILLQDHSNFDFTVRESIGLGNIRAQADDEDLMRAAKFARADEVIGQLALGLDTQLGQSQGGVQLSGGQEKRLAIARRMFAKTPIIVMDEPENKLDAESKKALFEQLAELPRHMTAIYVSHSLETLGLAERILVFEKGSLIEDGSSDELLANPGSLYRQAMLDAWDAVSKSIKTLKGIAPQLFS